MNSMRSKEKKEQNEDEPLWLFGYGSLLFKPPLHHLEISKDFKRYDGYINGYIRRFWQSSYDNRGTPEQKGRVVTIIPANEVVKNPSFHSDVLKYELNHLSIEESQLLLQNLQSLQEELTVGGCVYYIPGKVAKEAREYLDFREKDGYSVEEIFFNVSGNGGDLTGTDTILNKFPRNSAGEPQIPCVVYVGTSSNESFIGPEKLEDTATIIKTSVGPSGPNDEYLLLLQKEDPDDLYLKDLKDLVLMKD